jgi:tetratricopeptide (TPR) repeat protein
MFFVKLLNFKAHKHIMLRRISTVSRSSLIFRRLSSAPSISQLFAEDQFENVVNLSSQMLTKNPNDGMTIIHRGAALMALGRSEESTKLFEKFVLKNPTQLTPLVTFLLGTYKEKEEFETPMRNILSSLIRLPVEKDVNGEFNTGKGYACMLLEQYTEAGQFLAKALSENKNNITAWFLLGVVLLHEPINSERAEKCFDNALAIKLDDEIAPSISVIMTELAEIQLAKFFEKVSDENDTKTGLPAPALYLMAGELGDAITHEEEPNIKHDKINVRKTLLFHKIAARCASGKWETVLDMLTSIRKIYPDLRILKTTQAYVLNELGRAEEADALAKRLK